MQSNEFFLSEYTKKVTKFIIYVGWGIVPDPTGGAYSAPQTLSGFKGPLRGRRGMEGRTRGEGRERKGGMGREGKEGKLGE